MTSTLLMTSKLPFKWRHFQQEIILLNVRWYCRYPLSYRNLEEMMCERGLNIDHSTIHHSYVELELFKRCQRKNSVLTLKDRLYVCQCGLNICRDRNSAINLKQAPFDKITNRVGSMTARFLYEDSHKKAASRINACGHSSADTYGFKVKQEVNTFVQLSLFDLGNYG